VHLAAMMDLVLEQVRQDAADAGRCGRRRGAGTFTKSSSCASVSALQSAISRRSTARCRPRPTGAQAVEPAPHGSKNLPASRFGGCAFTARLEHVDVEPVDGDDVVERRLDRGEKAGTAGGEFISEASCAQALSRR